ncbi:MAG: ABC transporter permease [Planctomycetaceae bacterium]|nr:MAG: ABC transporter permease [Planctomycetaceae bacterium]
MVRRHVILAVFLRNFRSYFSGVIGYLFIVAFVLAGALLAFREQFFTNNLANLDQLSIFFPHLLLFIVPAVTMGVWSEEKKLGTEELLFTLPVSDWEVLLGKYLAVVAVYTVVLAFSLTHCLVLEWIGDPDWGLIATTYLGYWLAGCALLSAGMVASFLTNSSTVAFVLGVLICAIPVFIGYLPLPSWLVAVVGNDQLFDILSIPYQMRPFTMGMIPLAGVLYFVSFAALMLYINLVLIGQRHWAGGARGTNMGWQYTVRAVSLAVILISANSLLANVNRRLDMTSERLYSLTDTTRRLLRELKSDRPVTIQAFVSQQVPREYVPVRTTLLGLLDQYRQYAGNNLTIRIVNVAPFSPEAEEARQFGIEARKVQSERGGRLQVDEIFLGFVVNSGANEVVVPFIDTAIPIEYELTRSIRTAAKETRRTVGILDTDAKITGGFDMQSFRSLPEWRIVTELKKQYNVEVVPPSAPIDEKKYDVLIAVLPSSLDQQGMEHFVNYVKTGKPVLIFDDPFPAFNPGLSPRQPKPRPGGMMMGGMPPEQKADGGRATSLMNLLGVQWVYDRVVWADTIMVLHPEYADVVRQEMVAISPKSGIADAFNPRSEITNGLQEVLLFFSGTIEPREGAKHQFDPLMRTSKTSGLLEWDDFVRSGFFGNIDIVDNPRRRVDAYAHVVAAQIRSEEGAANKFHVLYVADADMISDWFFMVRERRLYGLDLDNVNFVLNAVDALAGDEDFIALRKRRPKHRTLTAVERQAARFIEQSAKEREQAAEEARQALERAKAQLKEKIDKIEKDDSLDPIQREQLKAIALEEERRRLEVTQAEIDMKKDRTIDEIRARTERQIRQIEHRYFLFATILPPIPALILGFVVWIRRLQREQSEVPPSRRRSA